MLVGDGKLKEDIKKQAEELNILNKVIFVGLKNNVNDYYQAFDIFILPSLYEGFGMVTIEAQASNLPCIVSDTVPKETKMSNDYCFLNLNSGINIWVDKIHELLIKNNRKDNTSSIIENGFDIRKETEKIENYYISCKKELK